MRRASLSSSASCSCFSSRARWRRPRLSAARHLPEQARCRAFNGRPQPGAGHWRDATTDAPKSARAACAPLSGSRLGSDTLDGATGQRGRYAARQTSSCTASESFAERRQQLDGSRGVAKTGIGELRVALIGNLFERSLECGVFALIVRTPPLLPVDRLRGLRSGALLLPGAGDDDSLSRRRSRRFAPETEFGTLVRRPLLCARRAVEVLPRHRTRVGLASVEIRRAGRQLAHDLRTDGVILG